MTPQQYVEAGIAVLGVSLSSAGTAAIVISWRHSRVRDAHPGAQAGVPTLAPLEQTRTMPAADEEPPPGRHHADGVRIVPRGWMPPPEEIRALEEAVQRARAREEADRPTGVIRMPSPGPVRRPPS